MAANKEDGIADEVLDQLLAGRDPGTGFGLVEVQQIQISLLDSRLYGRFICSFRSENTRKRIS